MIRAAYQVSGQAQAGHGSQGVVEFTPSQGMHPADLTAFFKQYEMKQYDVIGISIPVEQQ